MADELRSGYTTGACAAAGVKAVLLYEAGLEWETVELTALDGTKLIIPVKAVRETEHGLEAEVVKFSGDDPVIATTGKAGRELFEIREAAGNGHARDFLTVGSMGHCSSIALGIALHRPQQKVWCIDGDGAALMHMGAMAVIGAHAPKNLVHIIINNGAHETVGGMPTVALHTDFPAAARAFGYDAVCSAETPEALDAALSAARERDCLTLIEVKAAIGARADLGRPTASPIENKRQFMAHLTE